MKIVKLSPKDGRQTLPEVCEKMMREDLIDAYLFEIETPGGAVTEKRLLRTPPA